jgi:hypothetical protein
MKHEKRKKRIEDLAKEMPEIYDAVIENDRRRTSKEGIEKLEKVFGPAHPEEGYRGHLMHGYQINEYVLVNTCMAAPEQYDVYKANQQVAYFRVRHGLFSVRIPTSLGDTVYTAEVAGDGCFADDERDFYLHEGIETVDVFYNSGGEENGVY